MTAKLRRLSKHVMQLNKINACFVIIVFLTNGSTYYPRILLNRDEEYDKLHNSSIFFQFLINVEISSVSNAIVILILYAQDFKVDDHIAAIASPFRSHFPDGFVTSILMIESKILTYFFFCQAWTEAPTLGEALVALALKLPRLQFVIVTQGAAGCVMLERSSSGNVFPYDLCSRQLGLELIVSHNFQVLSP